MPTLNETIHAGAFIVQEGPGYYSRDQVTVALSQTLLAGSPVYDEAVAAGITSSAAADAGNTVGSGVLTLDPTTPVLANAQTGAYRVICVEPNTNAGTFEVFDPSGVAIGKYNVAGAAFSNQIKFTISDATDFAAGDGFTVIVGLESGIDQQVKALPNDGSQVCSGLMVYPVTTGGSVTLKGSRISRLAEVRLSDIQWPSGINAVNKAKAVEELRARGIIGRV
jgi:hypothetical protein